MDKKKLPTELNVEELLKIIESRPNKEAITKKEEYEEVQNNVFQFIIRYGLKPGYHKVPKKLIKELYCYWSGKEITTDQLSIDLGMYIPTENKYGKEGRYFHLNKSIAFIAKSYEELKPRKLDFRKSKIQKKLMEDFISEYSLKPGYFYVEVDILYYLFCNFVDKRKRRPIEIKRFTELMDLYFKSRFLGLSVIWYGLTEDITKHIPKELVANWRQGRVKYGKKSGNHKEKSKEYAQYLAKNNIMPYHKLIYEETLPTPKSPRKGKISGTRRHVKLKV